MKIIPAIDLIDGKCVRLTQGNFDMRKTYSASPLDTAKCFEDAGIRCLHLVDLDGARTGEPRNLRILEQIATRTSLEIDFGGGVRARTHAESTFNAGAFALTAGSIAVKDPQEVIGWTQRWGAERILIGADAKAGKIAVDGWQQAVAQDAESFIGRYLQNGSRRFVCTDIGKDGMMQGCADDWYRELLIRYPEMELIASGGVSSIDELVRLRDAGVHGAIIGKALYEGLISLDELMREEW